MGAQKEPMAAPKIPASCPRRSQPKHWGRRYAPPMPGRGQNNNPKALKEAQQMEMT